MDKKINPPPPLRMLFVRLLPLLFAFTISHDCIFLRNEEADVLKEEEVKQEPIDRQNEDTEIREDDDNLDILEEEEDVIPDAAENREEGDENDRMSSCSDIMEVDVPRAPTPDIVDLLDSDDDDDEAIMR